MKYWVLHDKLAGYFKQMTGIGPACTKKLKEAARFRTKTEALDCPAVRFSLTCFVPVKKESVR